MKIINMTSDMISRCLKGETITIIPAIKYHEHIILKNNYLSGFTFCTYCLN